MSHHQWAICMRDQQRDKGNKQRYHHRETRNLRQNICRVILSHHAGPTGQRMDFAPPVMTGVQVVPGVEMKTTGLGLLKIKKTGVAHKPRDDVNHDQKTGYHYSYACSHTRL